MDELHFIKNPHDALFRAVFGDPDNAAELLRSILPAAITAAIDWRTLRRVEGSFVDEALRGKRADVLFRAVIGDRVTLIYMLNEHKSEEDPWTALQMLRYSVAIWEQFRREHPDERTLPPILPIVLHHGSQPWRGPRDLRSLMSLTSLPGQVAAVQLEFWSRTRACKKALRQARARMGPTGTLAARPVPSWGAATVTTPWVARWTTSS